MHPLHAPRQRGVSLIEAVVVMAVLAFLLAQAMPSVSDWIRGLKLRNAAESIRGGIERARLESVKRNSSVGFWMVSDSTAMTPSNNCARSGSSPAWVVSVADPAGKCGTSASLSLDPQLVTRSAALENASGIVVAAVSATGAAANHVNFTGLGEVTQDTAPIKTINLSLAGSARRLRVVVEAGGAVRSCDPDVPTADARACPT